MEDTSELAHAPLPLAEDAIDFVLGGSFELYVHQSVEIQRVTAAEKIKSVISSMAAVVASRQKFALLKGETDQGDGGDVFGMENNDDDESIDPLVQEVVEDTVTPSQLPAQRSSRTIPLRRSVRLATQGLGSTFTGSGRRFSLRLAANCAA